MTAITLSSLFEFGPLIAYPLISGLLFVVGWFAFEETAGINAANWRE